MATILDGKALAKRVREEVRGRVEELLRRGVTPGLATILVGDDPASKIYVGTKQKACSEVGIRSFGFAPQATSSTEDLVRLIHEVAAKPEIHGILVQLPLPRHIDEERVIEAIPPAKDVDGLTTVNQGKLVTGARGLRPCTPLGIMRLIAEASLPLKGVSAVVVGRSKLVGKPVAFLLLEQHATVTMCHSRTRDLAAEVGRADLLVAAAGQAGLVKGEWVKPGAVVIDVGINRGEDGKLRGDVEFGPASERASAITPVPGGVGPMTVAMLLSNAVEAAAMQAGG